MRSDKSNDRRRTDVYRRRCIPGLPVYEKHQASDFERETRGLSYDDWDHGYYRGAQEGFRRELHKTKEKKEPPVLIMGKLKNSGKISGKNNIVNK